MLQRRSLSTLLVCSALCGNTAEATAAAAKLKQHLTSSGNSLTDESVPNSSSSTNSCSANGHSNSNGAAVHQLSASMQALNVQQHSSSDAVQSISERCWQLALECAAALTAVHEAAAVAATAAVKPAAKPAAPASSSTTRAEALTAAAAAMKSAAHHIQTVKEVRMHALVVSLSHHLASHACATFVLCIISAQRHLCCNRVQS
jgi:hypothetical protein